MNIYGVKADLTLLDSKAKALNVSVTSTNNQDSFVSSFTKQTELSINYVSYAVSNANGTFVYGNEPTVILQFSDTITMAGITLSNDNISEAVVELFDEENVSLSSFILLRVDHKCYFYDEKIKYLKITIVKTKNANATAQIGDIDLSITYNIGDILYSINATKGAQFAAEESNNGEITIHFAYDYLAFFEKLNASTFGLIEDVPETIKIGQELKVYFKYTDDDNATYELFNTYYTTSMILDTEEEDYTMIIEGQDILSKLNETSYKNGVVNLSGQTLETIGNNVAADAGVGLSMANSIKAKISKGYVSEVPHREAFRLIAEAGTGCLYSGENGNVVIDAPNFEPSTPDHYIYNSDIVDKSFLDKNAARVQGISVSEYQYSNQAYSIELGYLEQVLLTTSPQHIDITYAQFPADTSTIQVFVDPRTSATIVANSLKIYSEHVEFDLVGDGTPNETTYVTITGVAYNVAETTNSVGNVENNYKKIEKNYLVDTTLSGQILSYQKQRIVNKNIYRFEHFGIMNIRLLDVIYYDRGLTTNRYMVTGIEVNKTAESEDTVITCRQI